MAQLELLKPSPDSATGKIAGAYRTISEVSEELGVPQHVLRFWENHFPQVKPSRMRGGRRYYRPEDVDTLKKIKTLLYGQGYTIKGAKKVVRSKEEPAEAPPAPPVQKKTPRADIKHIVSELRILKAMLAALA